MATEQNITPVPLKIPNRWATGWKNSKEYGALIGATIIALTFVVNGIALGLYGFDLVHPSPRIAQALGAISMAFASYAMGWLVWSGVRFHLSGNKKRK